MFTAEAVGPGQFVLEVMAELVRDNVLVEFVGIADIVVAEQIDSGSRSRLRDAVVVASQQEKTGQDVAVLGAERRRRPVLLAPESRQRTQSYIRAGISDQVLGLIQRIEDRERCRRSRTRVARGRGIPAAGRT